MIENLRSASDIKDIGEFGDRERLTALCDAAYVLQDVFRGQDPKVRGEVSIEGLPSLLVPYQTQKGSPQASANFVILKGGRRYGVRVYELPAKADSSE